MSNHDPDQSEKFLHLITLSKMMSACKSNVSETQAMMNIVEGSSEIPKSISDLMFSLKSKKKITNNMINNCAYAIEITREWLEKYVDTKTNKMREFLNYFKSLGMEVPEESKKLSEFETEWEKLKRKIADLNIAEFYNGKKPSFNMDSFQLELQKESKHLFIKLNELEERMLRNVRNMITFSIENNLSPEMKELLLKP